MLKRILALCALGMILSSAANAHGGGGGGGGGGHGGGHYVYIPIYVGGAAAAPLPPPPKLGDTSNIHVVAVLSGVGQTLALRTPGGIFGEKKPIDVSNWGLDDLVTAELSRRLSERFEIRNVAYDRAALAAVPFDSSQPATTALDKMLGAIANPGVDAFIVVRPYGANPYPKHGGLEFVTGRSGWPPQEWLGFDIEIIDAHTFLEIERCFARVQLRQGALPAFAGFFAANDRNLDSNLAPSDHQLSLLREDFKRRLALTLIETLRPLQLVRSIPQPGSEPIVPIAPQVMPFPQVQTVAVVSAIGDSLTFGYRTVMFEHHTSSTPIADWHLDEDVEHMIADAVSKRFTVKDVPVDHAALARAIVGAPLGWYPTGVLPAIGGLAPRADIDAYIVVLKRNGPIGDATDPVSGVGVWRRDDAERAGTGVFANYEIVLIDAHTLQPLRHQGGVASHYWATPVLYRPIDDAVWPSGTVDQLAPGRVVSVQQLLSDVLADSLPETLLEMGLTGMKRDMGYDEEVTPVAAAPLQTDSDTPSTVQ